jgi:hypothetical protein
MDSEQLFLASVEDLERYVGIGDDYAMLRAAALLRQLFMDQSPLVHQVNRKYRLYLKFPVCGRPYTEVVLSMAPTFYSALDGIHRSGPTPHQLEELSLDNFLATKVLKLGDNVLTIGDLISISANVLGGVHRGTARTEKEQAVEAFNRQVFAYGHPISAAQMRPVVMVALEGLFPLVEAAKKDL